MEYFLKSFNPSFDSPVNGGSTVDLFSNAATTISWASVTWSAGKEHLQRQY